jgi:hypothetical protein
MRPRRRSERYSAALLDHLVGAAKQRDREGEAERLRSFEIDDHLELAGLVDRKVAWLGAQALRFVP